MDGQSRIFKSRFVSEAMWILISSGLFLLSFAGFSMGAVISQFFLNPFLQLSFSAGPGSTGHKINGENNHDYHENNADNLEYTFLGLGSWHDSRNKTGKSKRIRLSF